MRIRQTRDADAVRDMHRRTLPGDEIPDHWDAAWLVYDDKDRPVGFATVKLLDGGKGVFLQRAGVLRTASGKGIQRKLIRVREAWSRRRGVEYALTYTTHRNFRSIANLIRSGYHFYEPSWEWAGPDVHYYIKTLYV